jgi:hypothetical protein
MQVSREAITTIYSHRSQELEVHEILIFGVDGVIVGRGGISVIVPQLLAFL